MKILLIIAILLTLNANSARAEIFGYDEVQNDGGEYYKYIKNKSIKDWRKITKKYKRAIASGGQSANDFRGAILKLRGKTKAQTIYNVDTYINRKIQYRSDEKTWDTKEYWANPIETTKNGSYGDCDDFALAKYFALQQLGIRDNDMRFVVLMSSGGGHAVLSVKDGNKTYILDNNLPYPVEDSEINFYDPIYTVNNSEFSFYKPLPKQAKTTVSANK